MRNVVNFSAKRSRYELYQMSTGNTYLNTYLYAFLIKYHRMIVDGDILSIWYKMFFVQCLPFNLSFPFQIKTKNSQNFTPKKMRSEMHVLRIPCGKKMIVASIIKFVILYEI